MCAYSSKRFCARRAPPEAAAASSSSSSSSPNHTAVGTWGRNYDSLERVHRELYRALFHSGAVRGQRIPTPVQQEISQVLQNSFPEWTWCEVHKCIRDNKTNMTGGRSKDCGTCSIQPALEAYTSSCESVPSNLEQLEAVREQWAEALDELMRIKSKVEADGHRVTDSGISTYTEMDRRELELWQAYSVVVFDVIRRHVIRAEYIPRVNQIATGTSREQVIADMHKKSPNLGNYERLLVDWTVDAVTHNGGMNPVNQMFCFLHNRVGDLMPVQGFDGYHTSCWICPLASEQASGQQSSRIRLTHAVSTSTFVNPKDITHLKRV